MPASRRKRGSWWEGCWALGWMGQHEGGVGAPERGRVGPRNPHGGWFLRAGPMGTLGHFLHRAPAGASHIPPRPPFFVSRPDLTSLSASPVPGTPLSASERAVPPAARETWGRLRRCGGQGGCPGLSPASSHLPAFASFIVFLQGLWGG